MLYSCRIEFIGVGGVGVFFAEEMVNPATSELFSLELLDKFEETILEFESQSIHLDEIRLVDLLSISAGIQPGNRFPKGGEGDIQKVQVLTNGTPTISFSDVAMHRISRRNLLGGNFLELERQAPKDAADRCVEFHSLLPNSQLLVTTILVLVVALHHSITPPLRHSTTTSRQHHVSFPETLEGFD